MGAIYNVTDEGAVSSILKKLTLSVFICFLLFILFFGPISASVTLLSTNTNMLEVPYAEALVRTGYTWMQYVLCPCAMCALCMCMLSTFSQLLSLVRDLTQDGILPEVFIHDERPGGVSKMCVLVTALLTSVYATLFNIVILVCITGTLCLLTCTMTCVSSLILRYQPYLMQLSPRHRARKQNGADPSSLPSANCYGPTSLPHLSPHVKRLQETDQNENAYGHVSHVDGMDINNLTSTIWSSDDSDIDIDDAVEDYREEIRLSAFTNCSVLTGTAIDQGPTDATARCARLCVVSLALWTACLLALITQGCLLLREGSPVVIILICVLLLFLILSMFILLRQPVESAILQDIIFHVRPTPWVQVLILVLNLLLLVTASGYILLHCMCWIMTGKSNGCI